MCIRDRYCYSGCLEGRGFDECGQKGFVVLDIDDEKLTAGFSFVPFAYRSLYTLYVDVTCLLYTSDSTVSNTDTVQRSTQTFTTWTRNRVLRALDLR